MSSVLKFFRKKIKPFKKCVSNPANFDGGGSVSDGKVRYSSTYVPARQFSEHEQEKFDSQTTYSIAQSSYETTENIQYGYNEKSVDGDCIDSDYYCISNAVPCMKSPISDEHQSLNESTPSYSKETLDVHVLNEEMITQRKRFKIKKLAPNKPLNGTYTLKVRSDCEDEKTLSSVTQKEEPLTAQAITTSDENLLKMIEETSLKNVQTIDSVSTSSECTSAADAIYDPFFSSTLKLSPSNLTTITREESRKYENVQAAVMHQSKQAQKRCLIEKLQQKQKHHQQQQQRLSRNFNEMLNVSTEKMRRSISLPGVIDQLSPVLGNISKISAVREDQEATTSNATAKANHTPTPLNTLVDIDNDDLLDSFMISSENLIDVKSQISINRSNSSSDAVNSLENAPVNGSFTTFEEFADDEHTASNTAVTGTISASECITPIRSNFSRQANEMRMSKTIKEMFKNVVKYQLNALGCLEKFYEAQVLRLETDRGRDLALNPQQHADISEYYDVQLQELEDRVYTNLKYICRNRCAGSMDNKSKSPRRDARVRRINQSYMNINSNNNNNNEDSLTSDESNESTFKRQYSLPHHSKKNKFEKGFSYETKTSSVGTSAFNTAASLPPRPKYSKNDDSPTRKKAQKKYQAKLAAQCQQTHESNDDHLKNGHTRNRRQIKSASSLQVLSEQENAVTCLLGKKRQILTNGSLNMVMSQNDASGYDRRLSNTFKRFDLNEILLEQDAHDAHQSRRHTFGSDKYSHLRTRMRHSHTDNHLVLKETQV